MVAAPVAPMSLKSSKSSSRRVTKKPVVVPGNVFEEVGIEQTQAEDGKCDYSSEIVTQLPATTVVKTPIQTASPVQQDSVVAPAQSAPRKDEASDDVRVQHED